MGQSRTLTKQINQASLEIARRNAAKPQRVVKYMHVGERLRYLARLHSTRGELAAKLAQPNRAS